MIRLALFALLLSAAVARAEMPVGLAELHIADAERPLNGLVWYPAQPGGVPTPVGDTRVFVGTRAVRDAPAAAGVFPLVLLSHGLGGHDLNQNWLAAHLAARGMVVAAINHPHSTTGDVTLAGAMAIWHRPADLSRTIDWLEANAVFGPHLDRRHIAAIGHSLGGYTALALAGVRLDCAGHGDEGCADPRATFRSAIPAERLNPESRDPRVTAVVAMAPGFSLAMTHDSLAAIRVPVLILAGALDRNIRVAHVRALVRQLPSGADDAELPLAGHFDFLPVCKPGGAALLHASGEPAPVCDSAADRAALHAGMEARIDRFLHAAMAPSSVAWGRFALAGTPDFARGRHAAGRHLRDFRLCGVGDGPAPSLLHRQPLHLFERRGGHEIPGGAAVAGHRVALCSRRAGNRL